MRKYIFTKFAEQHYKIKDDGSFPVGEVLNEGFTIIVKLNYPLHYNELIHLLSTIE